MEQSELPMAVIDYDDGAMSKKRKCNTAPFWHTGNFIDVLLGWYVISIMNIAYDSKGNLKWNALRKKEGDIIREIDGPKENDL